MSHTKEAVQSARFLSKGKWYLAQDVDQFLEELTLRLEEDVREQESLSQRTQTLQEECQRLRGELAERDRQAAEKAAQDQGTQERSAQERSLRELETQRDGLIQDIQALLRFREEFRRAVQQDVEGILGKLDALSSQKLL